MDIFCLMNLAKKLTSLCSLLPENKILDSMSNPNDYRRLIELAYVSYKTAESVTYDMLLGELQKHHPNVHIDDMSKCVNTYLAEIDKAKNIIAIISNLQS